MLSIIARVVPEASSDQREHQTGDWGAYTVDPVALRHGAGVEQETADPGVTYVRFRPPNPVRYEEGWLPDC